MTEGITRRVLIGINGLIESPDLAPTSTGTQYFISNSNVLSIDEDGIITTLAEGTADVTVIHGGAEYVMPVQVEGSQIGSTKLDTEGGVVEASDGSGSQVMISSGALSEEAEVSISLLQQSDLVLPVPEDLSLIGAFQLEVGENLLEVPAQLAIPAPEDLDVGTEVFFIRQGELPIPEGGSEAIWFVEESGVVGDDGMIRTQSPPFLGIRESGLYGMIALGLVSAPVAPQAASLVAPSVASIGISSSQISASGLPLLAVGGSATVVSGGVATSLALPTIALAATGVIALGPILLARILQAQQVQDEITVDVVLASEGEFISRTSAGLDLNLSQLTGDSPVAVLDFAPPAIGSFSTPIVQNISLDYDSEGVLIQIEGQNFGDTASKLRVQWEFGRQTYEEEIDALETTGEPGQKKITIRPAQSIPLGETVEFTVSRSIASTTDAPIYKSQSLSLPFVDIHNFSLAKPFSDKIAIINADSPREVIENSGTENLLLAQIPVGEVNVADRPRNIVATSDGSRAYVPLTGAL